MSLKSNSWSTFIYKASLKTITLIPILVFVTPFNSNAASFNDYYSGSFGPNSFYDMRLVADTSNPLTDIAAVAVASSYRGYERVQVGAAVSNPYGDTGVSVAIESSLYFQVTVTAVEINGSPVFEPVPIIIDWGIDVYAPTEAINWSGYGNVEIYGAGRLISIREEIGGTQSYSLGAIEHVALFPGGPLEVIKQAGLYINSAGTTRDGSTAYIFVDPLISIDPAWEAAGGSATLEYSIVDQATITKQASILPEPIPEVPIPAAVWLFGSGLLGLIGIARRKKV